MKELNPSEPFTFHALRKVANTDSIELNADPTNGITTVLFKVGPFGFRALYSPDIEGLYGLNFSDCQNNLIEIPCLNLIREGIEAHRDDEWAKEFTKALPNE